MEYIETIDTYGGMVKAIESGFPQREIHEAAYKSQKDIDSRKKIIVGVNKFVDEPVSIPILQIDPKIEKVQINRLKEIKENKRNNKKVKENLKELQKAASMPDVNIIPFILNCVRSYCSIGEISNELRNVWGEYQPPDFL
jgi:methylmalonyl-CoA mutase N-terminal domain/subunit